MHDAIEITADMPIAELGRRIMAGQLAIMATHRTALHTETTVTAVHETRKAIRRTFTAVRLFSPYFEPGLLAGYYRQLRKVMKRLGRCRDTAVFLGKLRDVMPDSSVPLAELEQYWQTQKTAVDVNLQRYLERPKWATFGAKYAAFVATSGIGVLPTPISTPVRARYVIPVLLYQRVASVRAHGDYLTGENNPSIKKMHQLRIQCKELRYAFQFFAPLLGPEIVPVIDVLKLLQVNLGDLNDASVALKLLGKTPGRETAVAHYRTIQNAEIGRLLNEFQPLWAELNTLAWRQNLALAVAGL